VADNFFIDCEIKRNDFVVTLQRGAGHFPKQWNFNECEEVAKTLVQLGIKIIMLDPDSNEIEHIEGDNIYSVRSIQDLTLQKTAETLKL